MRKANIDGSPNWLQQPLPQSGVTLLIIRGSHRASDGVTARRRRSLTSSPQYLN
ncbi:hypothetical protein [Anabaena azotica]|uniref:Uncharacterized protein n=1 Tax=Anabaena azotica FACHB-119 TaxID=947527 RepID=A0ABR8DG92_9NOST|nr:hypothetical protein [Anabaena azotica]MBD2505654.1 hypothetical protein [Anabaena azotica FACHB-119]